MEGGVEDEALLLLRPVNFRREVSKDVFCGKPRYGGIPMVLPLF